SANPNREWHGQRPHRPPGRPRAQPQERRSRDPTRPAGGDHRPLRVGQVLARFRHHLRPGPAPLRGGPLGLRPAVHGADGEAGRRLDRGSVAGHLDRAEDASRNPRSTVGTVTEIYDYLRVLYARVGTPHCPKCGQVIAAQTVQQMVDRALTLPAGSRIAVLAPIVRGRKGEYRKLFFDLRRQGYSRVRVNGAVRELAEEIELDKNKKHTIEVVVDRLVVKPAIAARLADSLETALKLADGVVVVEPVDGGQPFVFSERLACARCGISFPEVSPRMFSFNNPYGACPECGGLGTRFELDPELMVPDPRKSLKDGALAPWAGRESVGFKQTLQVLARRRRFSLETPWRELGKATRELILHGTGEEGGFDGMIGLL